jgi:putative transcriptional regulator
MTDETFGDDLIASLTEAVAHAKGEPGTAAFRAHAPIAEEIRALRIEQQLSRAAFAARYGLDARALQDWEQGRRTPDRAARVLFRVIRRNPDLVAEVAASEAA